MQEAVWIGWQPQRCCNGIISTPLQYKQTRIPKPGANLVIGMEQECAYMPLRQHTKGSNTLNISNMDVGSGLRWMSASNMTEGHHFNSISDPESPNLGPTWTVEWYKKGAPICPWDSIPKTQTIWINLTWMWEAVWGGWQPRTWRNRILSTP